MTPTPRMDELVRMLQKDNPVGDNWTVDLIRIGQDLERENAALREALERIRDSGNSWPAQFMTRGAFIFSIVSAALEGHSQDTAQEDHGLSQCEIRSGEVRG